MGAYYTSYKVTTQNTPFNLVYGVDAIFPIEQEIPTLRVVALALWRLGYRASLNYWLLQLVKLDEERLLSLQNLEAMQKRRKA